MRTFAVVFVRKGHLKVTKTSGISPINKCIMEIEKTNKVTEMAKKNGKSNARGEKCLAKFTAGPQTERLILNRMEPFLFADPPDMIVCPIL